MVSTRSTSRSATAEPLASTPDPEDLLSPKSQRTTTTNRRKSPAPPSSSTAASPSPAPTSTSARASSAAAAATAHTPTRLTLLWMAISLPLVAWDTAYILLRPHTMPGGSLHRPLWTPYALYGTIDGVYGFKAWHAREGFTAAQGLLNLVESVMYVVYLWLALRRGADGQWRSSAAGRREGAAGLLVGFSAAVMTLSKTVLYWAREYYCDFDNIGHNDAVTLFFLWIIPNGAWLVGSTYMIISMGREIVDRMSLVPAMDKSE